MYGTAIEGPYVDDRYLELAARIEWEEQGSVERPRPTQPGSTPATAEPRRS